MEMYCKAPGWSEQLSQTSILRNRDRDAQIQKNSKSGAVLWELYHHDKGLWQAKQNPAETGCHFTALWSPPLSL